MSQITRVVELEKVSMQYRRAWRSSPVVALDSINLTISRGETVGFIGNNGAGKSTTLRIILGLQKATSGKVRLNGLSAELPEARRGVAYVPESPYLYDYLSPLELLTVGMKMHRRDKTMSTSQLRNHCLGWLHRFGIEHVADKRIRTFSKGMTQRAALAHALACDPEFLILDEPLSGLDPIGRLEVANILDEYRESGGTLFFSSHVLNDVERLADRFVFIHQGRIRAVCLTGELLGAHVARYQITTEGNVGLDGFARVSSRLWQAESDEEGLSTIVAKVVEAGKPRGINLHSIRNVNSLERAYSRFIDENADVQPRSSQK